MSESVRHVGHREIGCFMRRLEHGPSEPIGVGISPGDPGPPVDGVAKVFEHGASEEQVIDGCVAMAAEMCTRQRPWRMQWVIGCPDGKHRYITVAVRAGHSDEDAEWAARVAARAAVLARGGVHDA